MRVANFSPEIDIIIRDLTDIYSEFCNTVVLYGSASRNELVYQKHNERLYFSSDMEFIVIPDDKSNEQNKSFMKMLIEKSAHYFMNHPMVAKAPFVDVNPVSIHFFTEAQPRISTFELKKNGIVLKGQNVLELLPSVDLTNYNGKIQNIEVVKGLKILLIEANKWFLERDIYKYSDDSEFRYFLCSCFLNVLRTLLPAFGIFESTASGRIRRLSEIEDNIELQKFFTKDIFDKFRSVYNQKCKAAFTYSSKELFNITFESYKCLLALLLNVDDKKDLIAEIDKSKSVFFWGDAQKINLLSKLTQFFLSALSCVEQLINHHNVDDDEMNRMKDFYDELLYGKKAFSVSSIISDYTRLEKDRWNIISSKD